MNRFVFLVKSGELFHTLLDFNNDKIFRLFVASYVNWLWIFHQSELGVVGIALFGSSFF